MYLLSPGTKAQPLHFINLFLSLYTRFHSILAGRVHLWLEVFILVLFALIAPAKPALAQVTPSITNVVFSPPSPTNLKTNQFVTVTFDYTVNEAGGVRIWAIPFSNGAPAPRGLFSASPIHPTGSGNVSREFTISADETIVDQVQFRIDNANGTVVLYTTFVPVNYHFIPPIFSLSIPSPLPTSASNVPEGAGAVTFLVTLDVASPLTATVNYSTSTGTAIANQDYIPANRTLVFLPGVTSQTFSVPIINDQLMENDKTFVVSIANPTNAILDPQSSITITLLDDDRQGAASFGTVTSDRASIQCGDGTAFKWCPEVYIYKQNGELRPNINIANNEVITTTNTNGQIPLFGLEPGDHILALFQQDAQTTVRNQLNSSSYDVYITNWDVLSTGSIFSHTVSITGVIGEQELTVKKNNPLVLFNIAASTDWFAFTQSDIDTPATIKSAAKGLQDASNCLMDATDGQFALGHVTLYDAGRYAEQADLIIQNNNKAQPRAKVGGSPPVSPTTSFTYTSGSGQKTSHRHGQLVMPRVWQPRDDTIHKIEEEGGSRTLCHELAHYLLFLYDEYFYRDDSGNMVHDGVSCTDNRIPDRDSNASIMDDPSDASELSARGTRNYTDSCNDTEHGKNRGESDWETILRIFSDEKTPPRWIFNTPTTVPLLRPHTNDPIQVVVKEINPGPFASSLPSGFFPEILIADPEPEDRLEGEPCQKVNITEILGGQSVNNAQVFVHKKEPNGSTRAISQQNSPDANTGDAELCGIEDGDEIFVLKPDGSLSIHDPSATFVTGATKPVVAQTSPWHPNITTIADFQGIALSLTQTQQITLTGDIAARLIDQSGKFINQASLQQSSLGTYTGKIAFPSVPRGGHIWLEARAATGITLTIAIPFIIEDGPGSEDWSFAPIVIDSHDGNFNLYIPPQALPAHHIIMVSPVYAPPAGRSERSVQSIQQDSTGIQEASASLNLELVGTAYQVRAAGINGPFIEQISPKATLTIHYPPDALTELSGVEEADLQIYYWNEITKLWEEVIGGTLDSEENFITALVDQLGVYAIMAPTPSDVTFTPPNPNDLNDSGWRIFRVPFLPGQPIEQVLDQFYDQSCIRKYEKVYAYDTTDLNDPWKQYIPEGVPNYINDLQELKAGVDYLIKLKPGQGCVLNFDAVIHTATARKPNSRTSSAATVNPPFLPSTFYGTIKDKSNRNLPIGSFLIACIGEQLYGSTRILTPDLNSLESVYVINVLAIQDFNRPDTKLVPGTPITFRVSDALEDTLPDICKPSGQQSNSYPIGQSAKWYSDTVSTLDAVADLSTTFPLKLTSGGKVVSFPVYPDRSTITETLQPILGYVQFVQSFEQGPKTFYPDTPAFNTLTEMDPSHGYLIHLLPGTGEVSINIHGSRALRSTLIQLEQGLNLVSYLPRETLPVTNALASIKATVKAVHGVGGASSYIYLPEQINTLRVMEPGQGYWIDMYAPAILNYAQTTTSDTVVSAQIAHPLYMPVGVTPTNEWINIYSLNSTINGQPLPPGTVVTAVGKDGRKLGETIVTKNGWYGLLPIFRKDTRNGLDGADSGESIRFLVNGQLATITNGVVPTWTGFGDLFEVDIAIGEPIIVKTNKVYFPFIDR